MSNQEEEVVSLLKLSEKAPSDEEANPEEGSSGKEIQQLSQPDQGRADCENGNNMNIGSHFGGKLCLLVLAATLLMLALPFRFRQKFGLLSRSHFHHEKQLKKLTFPSVEERVRYYMHEKQPKKFTFPSVEERVRYYMSNWYDIPHDYTAGPNRSSSLCNDIKLCKLASDCQHNVIWIMSEESIPLNIKAGRYETDTLSLFETLETEKRKSQPRIAMMYGDKILENPEHPVFAKVRYIEDAQPHQPVTSQAIITFLNSNRHYGSLAGAASDFAWQEKRNTLVFRGADTGNGKRIPAIQKYNEFGKYSLQDIDLSFAVPPTYTPKNYSYDRAKYRPWLRDWKTQHQLLQYKYLLVMEGNDVSSGLKWMLFSNSVVFMAKPKIVSWAMEDLLEPFVHYVPVKDDYSDLLEMLEWARAHDEACKLISHQATQYMYDLHMSPKAAKDREEILRRMMQRYYTNYSPILSMC